jgi:hypothetical protein
MTWRSWRWVALALSQFVSILIVGSAPAAEDPLAPRGASHERWLPGLAGFGGVITQDANATIDSAQRGFVEGDAFAVFAHVGLSAELMTPTIVSGFGAPRLFVHADISGSFDSEESIANEGDPGTLRIPVIDNNSDGIPDGEPPLAGIMGRGSSTRAETQPWVYSAGAGVAFHFEAWDRSLRLKPSLEWLFLETRIHGLVGDAATLDGSDQCPCRTALVGTRTTEGFHYLGAGLEVELDASRAGPFMLSVFAAGQGYRVLSDRNIELTASGSYIEPMGPPVETLSIRSTYELEPWNYRLSFGLRFRWNPE